MGGLDGPGQPRLDSDCDSLVGIHSEGILLNDMINRKTDHLIVLNYPPKAGGKFISNCLSLHPSIVMQDRKLAESKIRAKNWNPNRDFQISKTFFDIKKKRNTHIEMGCQNLAGFSHYDLAENLDADEVLSNEFWHELTNQKNFFFFMVEHFKNRSFKNYVNHKAIILKNFEWILDLRQRPDLKKIQVDSGFSIGHNFDMNSIKNKNDFHNEIRKVFKFLGIDQQKTELSSYLENLRKKFLETVEMLFERKCNFE